ncbi:hypothetical protein V6767_11020 [Martelella sp. FLE1502]
MAYTDAARSRHWPAYYSLSEATGWDKSFFSKTIRKLTEVKLIQALMAFLIKMRSGTGSSSKALD